MNSETEWLHKRDYELNAAKMEMYEAQADYLSAGVFDRYFAILVCPSILFDKVLCEN